MTKKQLAIRMRTQKELVDGVPVFDSKAWIARKKAIRNRVQKRVEVARARKLKRKK